MAVFLMKSHYLRCYNCLYSPNCIAKIKPFLQTCFLLNVKKERFYSSTIKAASKQNIKNYRPISLILICGKIFERTVFNGMFSFSLANRLISPNQFGPKLGDSCINRLLSITHGIYKSFDNGLEFKMLSVKLLHI